MAKRGSRRKKKEQAPPSARTSGGMEKLMAGLTKIFEQQDFKNEAEANAYLQNLMESGEMPKFKAETPAEKAQELVWEARELPPGRKKKSLLKKAIKLDADNAEIYLMMAEDESLNMNEVGELYDKAVAAGRRTIGDEYEELIGDFWGFHQTRPYMRALEAKAHFLWMKGYQDDAIGILEEMLRLNPGDNQGVRYSLIYWYMLLDDRQRVKDLLKHYSDDVSPYMAYNHALFLFRQEGNSREAVEQLQIARRWNSHVPNLLLVIPENIPQEVDEMPGYITMGSISEALDYAGKNGVLWQMTRGALAWLREVHTTTEPPKRKGH